MKELVTSELHSTGSHVLCMLKYYYAVVVYNAVGYRKDVDPPSKMARNSSTMLKIHRAPPMLISCLIHINRHRHHC